MRYLLPLLLAFSLVACQEAPQAKVQKASVDENEYEVTPVDGSEAFRAERKDALGAVVETGFILNGLKQGTWTNYNFESSAPEKITSYIDGALNGPYIELDKQGRIALLSNYKANVLHGAYATYKIGRAVTTANYIDGKLDGIMIEYDYRTNKIKQEVTYKMGVQDGAMRYYNEDGKITLEYLYKDGERVSGGIIE